MYNFCWSHHFCFNKSEVGLHSLGCTLISCLIEECILELILVVLKFFTDSAGNISRVQSSGQGGTPVHACEPVPKH